MQSKNKLGTSISKRLSNDALSECQSNIRIRPLKTVRSSQLVWLLQNWHDEKNNETDIIYCNDI